MHTLVFYAFCNMDDMSWGTKGQTDDGSQQGPYYKEKVEFLISWLLWNSISTLFMVIVYFSLENKGLIVLALGVYGTVQIVIKCTFAVFYHIKYYFTKIFFSECIFSRKKRIYRAFNQKVKNDLSQSNCNRKLEASAILIGTDFKN